MPELVCERTAGFDGAVAYETVAPEEADTPVVADVEVLVCGGGVAGAIAAIAAARQGADTLVVEATAFLGGIATVGGIHYYYHGVDSALQRELDTKVAEVTRGLASAVAGFHPEGKKLALQQMAEDAGVKFLLRRSVVGVLKEEARVVGVILDGPAGREVVRAKAIVDSTGDADVAALAGAEFLQGRDRDGNTMAYSMVPGRLEQSGAVSFANYDAGWVDPTNAADVSRAYVEGRGYLWCEPFRTDNRQVYIAPLLGLREGRLIRGDYALTLDDLLDGKRFADTIGPCRTHYDNHSSDYANESDEAAVYCDVAGCWSDMVTCDIPYRVMLPHGIEGMLVACRGISITHDAQSALRMQRDMMKLGEAAGIAAALAAKSGVTPRALDMAALQAELLAVGALRVDDIALPGIEPEQASADELIAALAGDGRGRALFELYRRGPGPELEAALASDQPDIRIGAALALALHGSEAAREPLTVCLRERYGEPPPGYCTRPRWFSAAVALSFVGGEGVGEELAGLLEAEDGAPDLWLHVLRGVQRLGCGGAVPRIEAFVERLQGMRELWDDPSAMVAVGWKLELAAAETLCALGAVEQGKGLAAKYVDDERVPVREAARRV